MLRWIIFIGWEILCWHQAGAPGLFYGFVIFGFAAFILYTLFDAWGHAKQALSRPVSHSQTTNNTLNVNVPARRGEPYNGPDAEDWGGMITTQYHRREKQ